MDQKKRDFLKYMGIAAVGSGIAVANAKNTFAETIISGSHVTTDTINAPTGRAATVVVAASDSSAKSKAQADYVCDGVDDNVEIQAAIDSLLATGGWVHLLEGNYIPSVEILPKNNTRLTGAGRGTVLTLKDDCPTNHPLIRLLHVDNVYLSSMVLDGNKTHQSDVGSYFVFEGVDISTAYDCTISDMYIRNTYSDGIDIDDGINIIVENCRIEGCRGSAVHISQLDPQKILTRNVFSKENGLGMLRPGFDVYNDDGVVGDYCIYDGCVSQNDYRGFSINGSYNSVINCRVIDPVKSCINVLSGNYNDVTNCKFVKNNDASETIVQFKSDNSNFSNNIVYTDKTIGISIEGTNAILSNNNFATLLGGIVTSGGGLQKSLIVGNCFKHIGATGSGRGIDLAYNSSNNIISNNHIEKATWTIHISSGCANNKFSYNVFQTGLTGVVNNSGTSTIFESNIGYVTESLGIATIATGQTTVNVSHGLAAAPTRVILSPTAATAGKQFYVSAKAASTFTITIDSAHSADISFDWQAVI